MEQSYFSPAPCHQIRWQTDVKLLRTRWTSPAVVEKSPSPGIGDSKLGVSPAAPLPPIPLLLTLPAVCYVFAASCLAQASATLLSGLSSPGMIAQLCFSI